MKIRRIFSVPFLLVVALFLSANSVAARDEWVRVRSKNFQLVGNAAEKDIRQTASKLEQFRETFRRIFTKINHESPVPINVVVFKDDESFRDFKPIGKDGKRTDWVAGYFQSGEDVNYIALTAQGEKEITYRTIFHEYVHFLVNNSFGRGNVPPWFNEGLAEYYEQFRIEDDQKVTLGNLNNEHLLLLRRNKLIPFETFFNTDNYSLQRQGNDGAGLFYAQAWALMHYLTQGNDGARIANLNKFINLVVSGKSPKDAFTETFQTDYATMERELKKYVEQRSFRASLLTFKNKLVFDGEMRSAPVSEAEAKAVLGDLLYHSDRLTEAAAMLEQALRLDARSSLANTALGLVRMRQANFAEAEKYLQKGIEKDEKNYLAHYYYAYVLSRQGMSDYGFVSGYDAARAEKMREVLKRSIELNPNFAESYNLYAFVNIVRNESIDEAIAYLDKAIKLAPGNQWYQMRSAELCMRKEDFTNARRVARKVFETAPDDRLRVYAKNTMNMIDSLQAQLENIKNFNRRANQPIVSDKPLTEEEIQRLNEQAMLEAVNQALRKTQTGEKRILGYLSKIVCGAKGIEYAVKVDNQILSLSSQDFNSLFLMSFDGELSDDEFGCSAVKKDMFAIITYRPSAANTKGKSAGEVIAIEFVPKNFKFIK